jgi:hypothetical protein
VVAREIEGFAAPALVTGSLAEAVDGAGVVAVTVPTVSLPTYAAALAQATTGEQLIWLNRVFGTVGRGIRPVRGSAGPGPLS